MFDFWSFLALVSHNRSRHSRRSDLILILGCMTSNLLVLELLIFYYQAALRAKPNQKRVAASSLQEKDKTADGSGFSSPPFPALLLIF